MDEELRESLMDILRELLEDEIPVIEGTPEEYWGKLADDFFGRLEESDLTII